MKVRNGHARAETPQQTTAVTTIGAYLISQLLDYGIEHVFGIPGDYVLGFYDQMEKSPLKVIGTTREDCAGYAADAYARLRGMGALCVTYCVGGLNVANAIAQAYAEKSPVVLISGSPGVRERHHDPLLHHKVRTFTTQREIFDHITCASTVLDDPATAFCEIDRVLEACWTQKRPVYIELPRDMVDAPPEIAHPPRRFKEQTDAETLEEALQETTEMLNRARSPVVLADVELHRFGLQAELRRFLEKTNLPVASTILGKSVIGELYPLYLGIYEGALGQPEVTRAVEQSDCLLMLGTFLTDINLGVFTAHLDRCRTIEATSEKIQIKHHAYHNVRFKDFVEGLLRAPIKQRPHPEISHPAPKPFHMRPDAPITVARLFERLNELLADNMTVISDVGDSLFGSTDLVIHRHTEFISPAYYTSMGFAVPAAVGAQFASPRHRMVVLVGDGAFQMTGMELSTIARHGFDPIVIVLDNHGYTTERFIMEGPYNDIFDWNYHKVPELLGRGKGYLVRTEGEFEVAWNEAVHNREEFSLLNVQLGKTDHSVALERLAKKLCAKMKRKA